MDLEALVEQPTWKEMLIDLVYTEKLDPWNIDIAEVAERFIARVKHLQTLDLRIPANLILASAILLRFKSEDITLEEEEQVVSDETFIEDAGPVSIPMIQFRTRLTPTRRVTLDELVDAIDTVFHDIDDRIRKRPPPELPDTPLRQRLKLEVQKFDIESAMEKLLHKAKLLKDDKNLVLFSHLVESKENRAIIHTLIPLLHLAQNGTVSLFQEQLFSEIFIVVGGET